MAIPQPYLRIGAVLAGGIALGWGVATITNPAPVPSALVAAGSTAQAGTLRPGNSRKTGKLSDAEAGGFDSDFSSMVAPVGSKPGDLLAAFRDACQITDSTDAAIRLREIVRTLTVADMPEAFAKARKLPYQEQWRVISELGRRYAELDIKAALAFGQTNKTLDRFGFMSGVLGYWANRSPDEAISWINALPGGSERGEFVRTVSASLSTSNPQAALQLLKQNANANQSFWSFENLFSTWSSRDPAQAKAGLSELKGYKLQAALRGVARTMGKDDPKAALEWADTLDNAVTKKAAIGTIAEEWALADPIAVINWASNLKDDEMQKNIRADAISKLAATDLGSALNQIELLPVGDQRDQMVLRAAETLGNRDAKKALDLLTDLPNTPEKKRTITRLCSEWASTEPRAALDWLFKSGSSAGGDYSLNNVIGNWAQQNPEEALDWANGLASNEGRDMAMAAIVTGFTNSEPARAQQLFSQLSPDGQATAAGNITYALVTQDFGKGRNWAESLPPGKAQSNALGVIGYQYAVRDTPAAAKWLETLPAGAGRDRAITSFTQYVANKDPEGAIAWALTISDERDRAQRVEELARRWIGTDSAVAKPWIQASQQLTPDQKKRILDR